MRERWKRAVLYFIKHGRQFVCVCVGGGVTEMARAAFPWIWGSHSVSPSVCLSVCVPVCSQLHLRLHLLTSPPELGQNPPPPQLSPQCKHATTSIFHSSRGSFLGFTNSLSQELILRGRLLSVTWWSVFCVSVTVSRSDPSCVSVFVRVQPCTCQCVSVSHILWLQCPQTACEALWLPLVEVSAN